MAITVCSTSTPSSVSLPTLSSSLKTPHHLLHLNNNHDTKPLSFNMAYNDKPKAKADAKEGMVERERMMRRKKRRKRRKTQQESSFDDEDEEEMMNLGLVMGPKYGHYLTTNEEAEYTMFIKEEARLEALRMRILDNTKQEPSLKQWAEEGGITVSHLNKILCGARESRERVNGCYRRLVVSIASRYQDKGLSLQDLIQEGSIGLIRGAKKFDPDKGYKLSTYIYWWIRQAITKSIAYNSRTIRLPVNICEKLPRIAEANANLTERLLRPPTHNEIAEIVDIDVSLVQLIHSRISAPISLDQAVTIHGCMNLQDIIAGSEEMTPEVVVKKKQIRQALHKLLNELSERELHILALYYGLNGKTPKSYKDIGTMVGLSRERVRQINNKTLTKLQKSSIVDKLKLYT